MLVLDPEEVAVTDTADHASRRSPPPQVHDVIVLGRRGPAQAAFTDARAARAGRAHAARTSSSTPPTWSSTRTARTGSRPRATPTNKRNVELMREYAQREPHGHERRVELRFLRSPVEILGEGEDGPVTGIRIVKNEIENGRAVADGRGGGHLLRPRDPLDRLPRRAAGRHPVRRAPRADLQPRRARARRRAASTRSASTSSAGSSAARPASSAPTRRTRPTPSPGSSRTARPASSTRPKTPTRPSCEQFLAAAVPGARHLGGLARDRRARDRPRRAAGPPAGQARAHGRDGRHRLRRAALSAAAAPGAARRGRGAGPRRG